MLNKATLIGRVGREPEVRYMANGQAVSSFSLATTDRWKDKDGNAQEKTEWHNVVAYRRLAEIVRDYVKKGDLIYIEGKIIYEKWQDKETGKDRYTTKIAADSMKMLGSKHKGEDGEGGEGGEEQVEQKAKPFIKYDTDNQKGKSFDSFDDDIPY